MNNNKIIFIVGPTAVGKSDVAYSFAQKIDGEIVSCDSMQVYREITIASNKPSNDILECVPHHLVNIQSVQAEFDVAQFNRQAGQAIGEILSRSKIPIIVGGSGLYVQILLDGIFQGGVKHEALRKDLKEQAKQSGNQFLYEKLKQADPDAAKKIHPNDVRRVVRALEISMTEDAPISQLQKDREGLWGKYEITLFCLNRERSELYDRIDRRVEQMFQKGIIEEVKALKDVDWSQTADKIIGVQEIRDYISGKCSLQDTKARMKLNTRHLAKRQLTWFRREKRFNWIMIESKNTPEKIAELIMRECQPEGEISRP